MPIQNSPQTQRQLLVIVGILGWLVGCASTPTAGSKTQSTSPGQEQTKEVPQPPPPAPVAEPQRPVELHISDLTIDPEKTVRISGTISSIDAIRLVPPKVIFKITDSTETITVLINEQVTLKEGSRIELVGRYQNIPSPAHSGPGEPPREAVFVVERFLDLP